MEEKTLKNMHAFFSVEEKDSSQRRGVCLPVGDKICKSGGM